MNERGTPELHEPTDIDAVFSDEGRWQGWLDVEAALAEVQAELEMIPREHAERIRACAKLALIDIEDLRADIGVTQAPVLSVVHALARLCGDPAGGSVHWGATTQNVILTGRVLQMRTMHHAMLARLANVFDELVLLAERGNACVMAGRTNRQPALPITFGFKVAGWIDEFIRHASRLREVEPRVFSLVFGGAIGAMQSFDGNGPRLTARLAERLDLAPVSVQTRAAVDSFVEYVLLLALIGNTCGRIAEELYTLMSPEFGEVEERQAAGTRGSSTLPQKVNPKVVMSVLSQASQLKGYVWPALEAGQPSHEGDAATNQTLNATLDGVCPLAYRLACQFETLLSRIVLKPERMTENVLRSGGAISAEKIMMTLAAALGRQAAHDLVHEAMQAAFLESLPVFDVLWRHPEVRANLDEAALRTATAPEHYLGDCRDVTDRALQLARVTAKQLRAT